MMPAKSIIAEAAGLGIRLFTKPNGSLGFDAPAGVLTPGLRMALIADKVAILALLRSEAADAPSRPRPLPWRAIVGRWSVSRRERWGRLANDLADLGFEWPEDEAEAFRRLNGVNPTSIP